MLSSLAFRRSSPAAFVRLAMLSLIFVIGFDDHGRTPRARGGTASRDRRLVDGAPRGEPVAHDGRVRAMRQPARVLPGRGCSFSPEPRARRPPSGDEANEASRVLSA